jgi:hypothetical protein
LYGAQVRDHVFARHEQRDDPAARFADGSGVEQPCGAFDVRHQIDGAAGRCFQRLDLLGGFDLRHHDEIRPAGEHADEIFAPAGFQRIDAHAGKRAFGAPSVEHLRSERARLGPQLGRCEILQLEDHDVGAGARRRPVRRLVRARNEEP